MITLTPGAPLRPLNTMGIDGTARFLAVWTDPSDLPAFFSREAMAHAAGGTVKPIGEGSNLLFTSGSFDGTLLLSAYKAVSELPAPDADGSDVVLRVGAGMLLDELAASTAARGLWGLENLSLIPGTVGAAAVQNVGAYGVEFSSLVRSVRGFDRRSGLFIDLPAAALGYGYRDSVFKHAPMRDNLIITDVDIVLSRCAAPKLDYGNLRERLAATTPTPMAVREAVIATRRSKLPDPAVTGSAGSFFKNPVISPADADAVRKRVAEAGIDSASMPAFDVDGGVKLSAAWLIDRAGWKGAARGNVGTWPSQPLVIVNLTGRATGMEVARFAAAIVADVSDKFGVVLHPEAEYL